MSITVIRNNYIEAKRLFNQSIAESITKILSGVNGKTELNDNLDIIITDGVDRVFTATPMVSINLRLNNAVADIVAQGDSDMDMLYRIELTPEQTHLYHVLNIHLNALATTASNYGKSNPLWF